MKILFLLLTMLVGLCLACKDALGDRFVVAEHQQFLTSVTVQHTAL